ncbi:Outer membrane efflux protein [Planctomycetes bacterium Pan216]|uniref:Outer membrane efflux protein n=1 Tax=Kolteria novifilia TaxID=2527975 RepID=A0A518AZ84_9BACT|nr:Outer membrane efflux protein [Planctomycetes bacterium Pan216]
MTIKQRPRARTATRIVTALALGIFPELALSAQPAPSTPEVREQPAQAEQRPPLVGPDPAPIDASPDEISERDRIRAWRQRALRQRRIGAGETAPPADLEYPRQQAGLVPERPQPKETLSLNEVLESVDLHYPLLAAILEERTISGGDVLAALGAFDYRISGSGQSMPEASYESERFRLDLEQATPISGIKWRAGYRLGLGSYPIYKKNYLTADGGEFSAEVFFPLLRNRPIDKRRAELRKAALKREIVEPKILKERIKFALTASKVYWQWVAAGQVYSVLTQYVQLAEDRDRALRGRVARGDLPRIEITDNQRTLVKRETQLVKAERRLQQAAIMLSLFYRDAEGLPIVPLPERLPNSFPDPTRLDPLRMPFDQEMALENRPVLRELRLRRQTYGVDLDLARNDFRPQLDLGPGANGDVGSATKSLDRYDINMYVKLETPIQRRVARGRMQSAQGQIAQIMQEERFAIDTIIAEVQDSYSSLDAAFVQILRANEGAGLSEIMEDAEHRRFVLGQSTLIFVNLRESQTTEAELLVVDSYEKFFYNVADYWATLGVDGLSTLGLVELPQGLPAEAIEGEACPPPGLLLESPLRMSIPRAHQSPRTMPPAKPAPVMPVNSP